MEYLFQQMGELFGAIGWSWTSVLLVVLYALTGMRIVREGRRGVYFRLGRVTKEVGAGIHWRLPWPFYRLVIRFCGDQVIDFTQGQQEVITKDGVTCRVEGSISYRIKTLVAFLTTVYDGDDQLVREVMAEIRETAAEHTYADCLQIGLGKKIAPKAVRRGGEWGLEVRRLNIDTFTPANPEARALVFLLDIARKRAESASVFLEAIEQQRERWSKLGVNPSILLAAIAAVPVSIVSYADQLSVMRDQLGELLRKLEEQQAPPDTITRVKTFLTDHVPGADLALSLVSGEEGRR